MFSHFSLWSRQVEKSLKDEVLEARSTCESTRPSATKWHQPSVSSAIAPTHSVMAPPAGFQHMRMTLLVLHFVVVFCILFLVPSFALCFVVLHREENCCVAGQCWPQQKSLWHNARRPQATDSCTATVHGRAETAGRNGKLQKLQKLQLRSFLKILTFLWHSLANFVIHVWQPLLVLLVWFETFTILPGGLLFSSKSKASLSRIYHSIYHLDWTL